MSNVEINYPYTKRTIPVSEYQAGVEEGEIHNIIGPNNVLLQVNYGCPLHCLMCDRWKWLQQGVSRSTELETQEFVSLFDQLAEVGAQKITFVGTEPVFRKDLPDFLKTIRSNDMKPEVYNSGILLPDQVIQAILDNSADVAFSIDGFFSESHNSIRWPEGGEDVFSTTLSSIQRMRQARDERKLAKEDVRLVANMTVQDQNIEDLKHATAEDIDALGVDMLRISLVHGLQEDGSVDPYCLDQSHIEIITNFVYRFRGENVPQTKLNYSAGIKYLVLNRITPEDFDQNILIPSGVKDGSHPIRCTIAEWSTMIDPEGNVYPCLYLLGDNSPYDDKSRHKYVMGNVQEESFGEIWNGEKYTDFRNPHFPNLDKGSRCWTCEYVDQFEVMNFAEEKGVTPDASKILQIGW